MQTLFGGPKGGFFLGVEEQNVELCEFKTIEEMETQLCGKLLH